jgi:hypothetical protein
MGWGARIVAVFASLVLFALGAWPLALLPLIYLIFSLRKPQVRPTYLARAEVLAYPQRPWGRYALGSFFFLLAAVAWRSGGTYSPLFFASIGSAVVLWPYIRGHRYVSSVVPVKDSVLLQNRLFPFLWHVLVEIKLESADQTRGIEAASGRLLLFAGKTSAVLQVISVLALSHAEAEKRAMARMRQETRMLSQRGAHLLPLDSADVAERLSAKLERLRVGTGDFGAVSSLPFDVIALTVKDGMVVAHRAYNLSETKGGRPTIPWPDLKQTREPLFAEVVQEIGKLHGWPGPDEFSSFLASLDASRTEPLPDRIRLGEEAGIKVTVETPGGASVQITRPQFRVLARIYA